MTPAAKPARLKPSDLAAVCALLEACALPTADLTPDHLHGFRGIFDGRRLIAIGALERLGVVALLRSVAVDPARRGAGHGGHIVTSLESDAEKLGIRDVYLLTDSADAYFARLGYRRIPRSAAPHALKCSAQFTQLCPASAVCMHKRLAAGA